MSVAGISQSQPFQAPPGFDPLFDALRPQARAEAIIDAIDAAPAAERAALARDLAASLDDAALGELADTIEGRAALRALRTELANAPGGIVDALVQLQRIDAALQAALAPGRGDVPFSAGVVSFTEASMALRRQQDAQAAQRDLASLADGAQMRAYDPSADALSQRRANAVMATLANPLGGAAYGIASLAGATEDPLQVDQVRETLSGEALDRFNAAIDLGGDLDTALAIANLSEEQAAIYQRALTNSKNGTPLSPAEALGLQQFVEHAQLASEQIQSRIDAALAANPDADVSLLLERQQALTRLRISEDTYYDKTTPELLEGTGFSRVSAAESLNAISPGLADALVGKDSGYFGAVYYNAESNTYVLSNRGTELGFTADRLEHTIKDLQTDAALLTGRPSQQQRDAINAAFLLVYSDAVRAGAEVEFTGHSLGGHLGTVQALSFDRSATVFNPAGLHDQTVVRLGLRLSNEDEVTRYVVRGEFADVLQGSAIVDVLAARVLSPYVNVSSVAQNLLGLDPAPLRLGVTTIPEAVGRVVYLPAPEGYSGLLPLHYTDALLHAMVPPRPGG